MKFTLEINMDNAAFGDIYMEGGVELSRIFVKIASEIQIETLDVGLSDDIRDINGNKVGTWEVTE